MIGSSSEISRETCRIQIVDGESSNKQRGTLLDSRFQARRCVLPSPTGTKLQHAIQRKKRPAGVRALIVAVKRCSKTPWSQGGQEGRYERTSP
jgi:hypothetical protein